MLVIDCATRACSVALYDNSELIAGQFEVLGRGHAERLVPMIAELPERGRANRIAVARGPGSFTGVRIGLAVARSLALAWDAEMVGYSTPSLVAAMAQAKAGTQPVLVSMIAGHGEWFVQAFDSHGLPTGPVESLTPQDAVERHAASLIAGTSAADFVSLAGSGEALDIDPDAREFHRLSLALLSVETAPIYGRAPDAKLPGASA